jgi:WD40 repeat protein
MHGTAPLLLGFLKVRSLRTPNADMTRVQLTASCSHEGSAGMHMFNNFAAKLIAESASSYACCCRLWDLTIGKCRQVLRGHVDSVNDINWQPYGSSICSGVQSFCTCETSFECIFARQQAFEKRLLAATAPSDAIACGKPQKQYACLVLKDPHNEVTL